MKKLYFLILVFLFIAGCFAIGGKLWIGGDNIPNQFLLEYILSSGKNMTNQFGLSGASTGLALWNQLPYAISFKILYGIFGTYADSIFFGLYLVVFFIGWEKLFFYISKNKCISYLLPFVLLSSSYSWLLINRNVLFQLILLASIPWIILSIKNIFSRGNIKDWLILCLILIFASGGFQNPGYAVPVVLLILLSLFLFSSFKKNIFKFLIIIFLGVIIFLPTLLGQINLLLNSENLKSDYWNTVILTELPLNNQKTTNTIDKVIIGYNSDTNSAEYGYVDGKKYYPWWFASFSNSFLSILLYIPIIFILIIVIYLPKEKTKNINILLLFLIFLIFMMKSSAGPGGDFFYRMMIDSGIMKMFRSPHAKFGFVYTVIICYIFSLGFLYIYQKRVKQAFIFFLTLYCVVFFVYPVFSNLYIPKMQKTSKIPSEYFEVRNFLQSQDNFSLGFLLPFNESTWDSNGWGYEGYHILHWMNTGVSFWNRNGLSFNEKNKVGYTAGKLLENFDKKGFLLLKKQGYDIIIYDKSSNRDERFNFPENHSENLSWLLSDKKYVTPIFSTENILVLKID